MPVRRAINDANVSNTAAIVIVAKIRSNRGVSSIVSHASAAMPATTQTAFVKSPMSK